MTTNKTDKKGRGRKIIIGISIGLIVLIVATLTVIPVMIMPNFLGQRFEQRQYVSTDFGIESERITLKTDDGLAVAAWRTRAEAVKGKGTVVILSGIQNPSVTAFFGYAKMFSDNGWDSLLIEMRARSESEGSEIGFGMTEWRDVKAGIDFLSSDERAKDMPIVAMGTSMGAGTVIIAAGELPEIGAVISISAPSDITSLFADNMPKALGILDIPFLKAYLGFHFGFGALKYSPVNGIAKLGERPILMMHSAGDTQVLFSNYLRLNKVAKKKGIHTTSFIREGDEHFICYDEYMGSPAGDMEFSQTILNFLADNFK
jgi:fermentation-respiration switch protein FrsA (DUF1100 family)